MTALATDVAGAPVGEQPQRARQVAALGGQRVLHAGRPLGCTAPPGRSPRARAGGAGRTGCSGRCPGSASRSSLNRRDPSSSASTRSRLQRSPTRSRATRASEVPGAGVGGSGHRGHGRPGDAVARRTCQPRRVSSNLQVTSLYADARRTGIQHRRSEQPHERDRGAPGRHPGRRHDGRTGGRRDRPPPARLRRRRRRRPGPDQRPQRPRRAGHRDVRRRSLDGRPAGRDRRRRRSCRDRGRHGRRAAARLGRRRRRSATGAVVFGAAASPTRRHAGHLRDRLGGRAARSAGPAAGGSAAASSTRRRSPPARPAVRSSTPTGRFLGLNTNRLGEGFYLALPADAALRARVDALGQRRVGRAAAARRRDRAGARRAPAAPLGRPARAGRPPRPRRRGRQPGRPGRDRPGRPDRRRWPARP